MQFFLVDLNMFLSTELKNVKIREYPKIQDSSCQYIPKDVFGIQSNIYNEVFCR